MAIVSVITHKVKDYGVWKKAYDNVKGFQKEGGVRAHSVMRASGDSNLVTVTHTFDNLSAAQAFFANDQLKKIMIDAGVDVSSLQVGFHEQVASGTL